MPIEVFTEAKCDRCGFTEKEQGAHGATPNIGWSQCSLSKRLEGEGWTNNERIESLLCPKCARVIAQALGQKRPYHKKQVKEPEIAKEI